MNIATEALLKFLAGDRPWLAQARCTAPATDAGRSDGTAHPSFFFHHPVLDFDGTDATCLPVSSGLSHDDGRVEVLAVDGVDGEQLMSIVEMDQLRGEVEQSALETCAACPVLSQCREWSLNNQVAGVSGGLTEVQRDEIAELSRDARDSMDAAAMGVSDSWVGGQINDAKVAELTLAGWSSARIARELGAGPRTVYRARARARQLGLLRPVGAVLAPLAFDTHSPA